LTIAGRKHECPTQQSYRKEKRKEGNPRQRDRDVTTRHFASRREGRKKRNADMKASSLSNPVFIRFKRRVGSRGGRRDMTSLKKKEKKNFIVTEKSPRLKGKQKGLQRTTVQAA